MNIGIVDADLLYKKNHRFPNLCSMKISAYHKSIGDTTTLLTSYDDVEKYDMVYISKVFTDTYVPEKVLKMPNVLYGGTGFFYDKAPKLPDCIEHIMPDYHLYDEFVENAVKSGGQEE